VVGVEKVDFVSYIAGFDDSRAAFREQFQDEGSLVVKAAP
jgi:hypothetical protein